MTSEKVKLLVCAADEMSAPVRELLRTDALRLESDFAAEFATALEKLQANRYDLILLDFSSFPAAVLLLRENYPSLPVIALIEDGDHREAEIALQAGAIDYVFAGRLDEESLLRSARYARVLREKEAVIRDCKDRHIAFVDNSGEGIGLFRFAMPMPVDLPLDEQIDHAYQHAYLAECNDVLARMYGCERADEIAGAKLEVLMPRDDPHNIEHMRLLIRSGYRINNAESIERDRSGQTKYFLNDLFGVVKDGALNYIWAAQRDITEFRRVQQELERSRKLYHTLAETFPNGGVYLIDRNGRILLAEGQGFNKIGISPDDIVGKTLRDAFGNSDTIDQIENVFYAALDGHMETVYEAEFRGRFREVRVVPVRDGSEITGVMAMTQDITERRVMEGALRKSEDVLKRAQSIAHLGHFDMDQESGIIQWSDELFRIFGFEPQSFAPNLDLFFNLIHEEDREATIAACQPLLEYGTPIKRELRIVRPDGEVRWISGEGEAILDEQGKPSRLIGTMLDITEHHAALSALRESQEYLRAALENGRIGLWDYNIETHTVWYSAEYKRQLGYAEDEIENTYEAWLSRLRPDDASRITKLIEKLIDDPNERSYRSEFQILHRDGFYRWMLAQGTILRRADGEAYRVIGTHVDITQLKLAENELRRSQTELQKAHDDLELRVQERTVQLAQANDLMMEEAAERQMMMSALHETVAQLEVAKAETERVNEELRSNEAHLLEGNRVFAELAHLRASNHGQLQEALHQITEAGSELLEVERCSVWRFNEDNRALHCLDLYVRSTQQHMGGMELSQQDFPNYFDKLSKHRLLAAVDAHHDPATFEFSRPYLTPLGINSMMDTSILIGGRSVGVLCCEHVGPQRHWKLEEQTSASSLAALCSLALESYERARAELELRLAKEEAEAAREQAEHASLAKSEFLSRMSHELRTPMNSILGFAQIMEMQATEEKQKQRIGHILRAGQHLLQLINEVLDMARVESGRLSISPEPIAVEGIVETTLDLVRPLCQQRQLTLTHQMEDFSNRYVVADQQRLSQVLLNLLSNAVKYNREGGSIHVRAEVHKESRLCISVSDTGYGIAPELQSRLFQPFERLSAEGTNVEGTGLGLALSKRLIEAMGGIMGVRSEVGAGSAFWLELPLSTGAVDAIDAVAEAEKEPSLLSLQKTHVILYIEDNLDNFRIIQHLLEGHPKIQLISAMQGQIGLELARQHELSLILLDVHLPDLTGDEVLQRLRSEPHTKDVPVIIVSADATLNQVNRLKAAGATEYLTKPLDVINFLSQLSKYLG